MKLSELLKYKTPEERRKLCPPAKCSMCGVDLDVVSGSHFISLELTKEQIEQRFNESAGKMNFDEFSKLLSAADEETQYLSGGQHKNKNIRQIIAEADDDTIAFACLALEKHTHLAFGILRELVKDGGPPIPYYYRGRVPVIKECWKYWALEKKNTFRSSMTLPRTGLKINTETEATGVRKDEVMMFTYESVADDCYFVCFNSRRIGSFVRNDDGYFIFFLDNYNGGGFPESVLGELAGELQKINKPWNDIIEKEIGERSEP